MADAATTRKHKKTTTTKKKVEKKTTKKAVPKADAGGTTEKRTAKKKSYEGTYWWLRGQNKPIYAVVTKISDGLYTADLLFKSGTKHSEEWTEKDIEELMDKKENKTLLLTRTTSGPEWTE